MLSKAFHCKRWGGCCHAAIVEIGHFMRWFERRIRRYEHRRWTTDDNRRVQPFDWGLEHIGCDPSDPHPAARVRQYARQAIENSAQWFETTPAMDYALDCENVLTFTSSIQSPWP